MVSVARFREMALAYEATDEKPHMHRQAFRVKEKIFATLLETAKSANLMLSPADQYVFCKAHLSISPVPGGWGRMGATTADLTKIPLKLLAEMLRAAYCKRAPEKLASKYRPA